MQELTHQMINTQSQTIKQVVIEVQNYSVSRKIGFPFMRETELVAEFVEDAKRDVTYELLEGLKKFINYDIQPYDQYVTAKIYMPFVYDDVYGGIKKELEKTNAALRMVQKENNERISIIERYEETWWIKLKNWLHTKQR